MRRVITGLVLGLMVATVPASAQSPVPCETFVAFAPSLVGLTVEQATEVATAGGYTLSVTGEGDIVEVQEPAPGATASRSTPIVVTLAPPVSSLSWKELKAKAAKPDHATLYRDAAGFVGKLVHVKGRVFAVYPDPEGGPPQVQIQIGRGTDFVTLLWAGDPVIPGDDVEAVGTGAGTDAFGPVIEVIASRRPG